jgi:hypothetical protein
MTAERDAVTVELPDTDGDYDVKAGKTANMTVNCTPGAGMRITLQVGAVKPAPVPPRRGAATEAARPGQASRKRTRGGGTADGASARAPANPPPLAPCPPQNVGYTITPSSCFGSCMRKLGRPLKGSEPALILQDISGWFEAGEMTALMGPSGSGKTVRARGGDAGVRVPGWWWWSGARSPATLGALRPHLAGRRAGRGQSAAARALTSPGRVWVSARARACAHPHLPSCGWPARRRCWT